ncbi:hypothetical protein MBLNU230_g1558t1 [Neophaeotheca triangularis]
MASAEVATRPPDRPNKRRPFAAWVRRLANLKSSDPQSNGNSNNKKNSGSKHGKKSSNKNNPYPESGHMRPQSPASSANGHLSFADPAPRMHHDNCSYGSLPPSMLHDGKEGQSNSNKSNAPTLATNPETVHSDAGHSKAFTNTTGAGALSSNDGAGVCSTFSSPNQSEHSLTTTLTTIQSSSASQALHPHGPSGHHSSSHHQSNQQPVMFSHQYPVSPAPSTANTISAIPPHMSSTHSNPQNYASATANNAHNDNASILTLASSSKRRRRSMDTDASVRALAPSSVWGGSRESLPLSVLSQNYANTASDAASTTGIYSASQSRPSIGGLASAERASIYSGSGQGVTGPALASERNSYYKGASKSGGNDYSDAKSLRSLTNIDARSQYGDTKSQYDARSLNYDAKSLDVGSLRNYEGSVRSGALGHSRNDSVPNSIGSPLVSPGFRRGEALSRRSSDWQTAQVEEGEGGEEDVGVDVSGEGEEAGKRKGSEV